MSPDKGMTGAIKQPAGGAGDPVHKHIEMMSRNSVIVRSSDNKRWRCYFFQPCPAVKADEASHRTTHGRRAIGGHDGPHPFRLLPSKPDRASRLRIGRPQNELREGTGAENPQECRKQLAFKPLPEVEALQA